MKTLKHVLILIFSSTLLMSCKKSNEPGSMSVTMTDAPATYLEVNVDIQAVQVNYEGQGWVSLKTNRGVYNLLDFQDGVTTVIADEDEIRAGQVNQMRLILGTNNYLMLGDSSLATLNLSSQDETGLKLNVNAYVESRRETQILIDFDASKSIVIEGNGDFKLKPHLKVLNVTNI